MRAGRDTAESSAPRGGQSRPGVAGQSGGVDSLSLTSWPETALFMFPFWLPKKSMKTSVWRISATSFLLSSLNRDGGGGYGVVIYDS